MSNNSALNVEIEEIDDNEAEIGKDDFAFVIGPDGELKSVMFSDNLMEDPPEEIMIILQLFGIDSLTELSTRTIH